MMLLTALFLVLGLQCLAGAQVTFPQPVANQVISGGVSFLVTCSDSTSAPHFSQMTNFSMLLFTGSYASPKVLFAWDLDNMMPSTVQSSIIIPRSVGPSATSAYFLGMSGWLSLNSSVSVTYFSSLFTLQNMTGPSSVIPSSTTASSPMATSPGGRLVLCEDSDGDFTVGENGVGVIVNQACEFAALAVINQLASTTSTTASTTRTSSAKSVTISPSVMSGYTAQIPAVSATATTSRALSPTANGGSQSQATTTVAANSSGTVSSRSSNRMVYCLIIAGLVLATIIALFWIWRRYRNKDKRCNHLDCNHSNLRKKFDRILRPGAGKKAPELEDAAEKGSVSVERTISVDVEVSPVEPPMISRAIMTPRSFERKREEEAEAEAAAVVAALASKAAAVRRQRFEEAMGNRESRRASRRTIVAELEGDLGVSAADDMPAVPAPFDFDFEERRDRVVSLGAMSRRTIVGQGQQGTVVKGRDAAVIVRVGSKSGKSSPGGNEHAASSSRVIEGRELPPMPVHRTSDDEDMNYLLQILYVKGDNDLMGNDDKAGLSNDRKGRRRSIDEGDDDVEGDGKTEQQQRMRDARKKRLRHKRNQLSAEQRAEHIANLAIVT